MTITIKAERITATAFKEFELTLPMEGNGFSWRPSFDHGRLALVQAKLVTLRNRGLNSGSIASYKFRPLQTGTHQLIMTPVRPSSKKPAKPRQFQICVTA